MKSENILMDEIVKIRRELKRIKKFKKKAKREKKLKKKTKQQRVSTKNLTNPEQPKPEAIRVTVNNVQPQEKPPDNVKDMSKNYLIPGHDLVADADNQLVVRRPGRRGGQPKITPAMQYDKNQLMNIPITKLRDLLKLRLPGVTNKELNKISGENKEEKIDFYIDKIRLEDKRDDEKKQQKEKQKQQEINQPYALASNHSDFGKPQKKDHFGLNSSQSKNSIFDDKNYDVFDDSDDSDYKPPKTFKNPKKVEKKAVKLNDPFDSDDAHNDDYFESIVQKLANDDGDYMDDINAGMKHTFYNPISDEFARATPTKTAAPSVRVVNISGGGAEVAKKGRGRPKKS